MRMNNNYSAPHCQADRELIREVYHSRVFYSYADSAPQPAGETHKSGPVRSERMECALCMNYARLRCEGVEAATTERNKLYRAIQSRI